MNRSILIQYESDERGIWCLYWNDTRELADPREFTSIKDAGAAANALLAQKAIKLVS